MRNRVVLSGLMTAVLSLGCGALEINIPLLRQPDACYRYARAAEAFDEYARDISRHLGTPGAAAAIQFHEPAIREVWESLPLGSAFGSDGAALPPGLTLAYAEYRLAYDLAVAGDVPNAEQAARTFLLAVGQARLSHFAPGCSAD